ncbi:MAG: ribonuclease E/G [Proteobacteria bacterium]|nr:ribonuclease E/G [Pseudomonadota bacterium]
MSIILHYDQHEGLSRAIVTKDGQVLECFFESTKNPNQTGAIHHGVVDRVLGKNAFVRIANGVTGFLNDAEGLNAGDAVLVQVKSEGRGDKGPGVTRNIALPGVYLVHQVFGNEVYFSRRLDEARRGIADQNIHELLEGQPGGWVIRKSSLKAPRQALEQELHELQAYAKKLQHLPEKQALCLPPTSVFEQALLMAVGEGTFEVLIEQGTDLSAATQSLKQLRPSLIAGLKIKEAKNAFDQGDLENFFQSLMRKKLELPGGGNVIFERTETLNLIDVNGGERGQVVEINREAAEVIMQHIRFRNIGGLIVIDFLKMKSRDDRDELTRHIHHLGAQDAAAGEVYGFTRMGLFEISRARRGFSLDEVLK